MLVGFASILPAERNTINERGRLKKRAKYRIDSPFSNTATGFSIANRTLRTGKTVHTDLRTYKAIFVLVREVIFDLTQIKTVWTTKVIKIFCFKWDICGKVGDQDRRPIMLL